jgi:hypothetical protein
MLYCYFGAYTCVFEELEEGQVIQIIILASVRIRAEMLVTVTALEDIQVLDFVIFDHGLGGLIVHDPAGGKLQLYDVSVIVLAYCNNLFLCSSLIVDFHGYRLPALVLHVLLKAILKSAAKKQVDYPYTSGYNNQ